MEVPMEIDKGSHGPASTNALLQWSQWQLLDSILPTGGFAHSCGLEAAFQAHMISGPEDLQTYVLHVLENTGSLLLPFVYSANMSPNLETWHKLDRMLDATLTNEVGRKASIAQGSALMRVAATVFSEVPSLKMMRSNSLGSGTVAFHHAPIFGLVCGLLGLDVGISQRAYMFITMRDVISAATRLNLIGPLGAAKLQHDIAIAAEEMSKKWMNRKFEEACQTAPLLDTLEELMTIKSGIMLEACVFILYLQVGHAPVNHPGLERRSSSMRNSRDCLANGYKANQWKVSKTWICSLSICRFPSFRMSAQLYPPDQVSQQFLITLWWEDPLHQVATLSMLDALGLAVNLIRHCRTKVVCPYGI
ncbi:Urease accessory protein F [Vitis vinifera]|uniref:Urease accessory protein F n=1 Tax=Vitis vinifera TaxID=29760 RepID=A0A438I847_VITVI|nr:Urease accessory protein F [Vitis vinifera]